MSNDKSTIPEVYFLSDENWGHCFVGNQETRVNFCLAVSCDYSDGPFKASAELVGAELSISGESLSSSEASDLLDSLCQNVDMEGLEVWEWSRADSIEELPEKWQAQALVSILP